MSAAAAPFGGNPQALGGGATAGGATAAPAEERRGGGGGREEAGGGGGGVGEGAAAAAAAAAGGAAAAAAPAATPPKSSGEAKGARSAAAGAAAEVKTTSSGGGARHHPRLSLQLQQPFQYSSPEFGVLTGGPGPESSAGATPLDDGDLYDSEAEQAEADEEEGEDVTDIANEELAQEKVLKSGYLYKKGERRKSWKKRWFVLRNTKLAYYKDEKEYKLLHIINLKLAHAIDEVRLKNHPYALGIVTRARTYYMQAGSRKELDEWLDVLWDVQARLLELRQSSAAELAGAGAAEERPVPTPGTGGKRCSADYGMLSAGTQTRGAQARPLAVKQTSRSHEGLVSDKPRPPDIYVGGGGRSPLRVQRSYHSATGVPCTESPGAYSSSGGQNEYTDSSEEEDNFLPDDIVGGDLGPTGSRPFDSVVPGAPTKTENNVIVKCGYLWKRGAKYNGWKKRWFVLRNQKLAYYKNEKEYELKGMIPLAAVLDVLDCDPPPAKNRPHCFRVITPVRPFVCCAESGDSQHEWICVLRNELAEVKNTISTVYDDDF